MAKTITRQTVVQYGSSGGTSNFGQFGSQAAGAPVTTKAIATIQSLTAWLNGLQSAVAAGQAPYLQDINSLFFVVFYTLCYLMQEGLAEWDAGTTYYIGSVVKRPSTSEYYVSVVDTNLNQALPNQVNNSNWNFAGYITDLVIARANAQNILINGGLEIWQRGTTFNGVGNNIYTADRWRAGFSGAPTLNVTQNASAKYGNFCLSAAITAVGGSTGIGMYQYVENYLEYASKVVSLSVWVKTTLTNVVISINDGVTGTASSPHPGDGAWHQLTVSPTIAATPTQLAIAVGPLSGSIATGTWFMDGAMLVNGPVAIDYVPRLSGQELSLCQRYYQTGHCEYTLYMTINAFNWETTIPFSPAMRIAPTVTLSNTSGSADNTTTTTNPNGFNVFAQTTQKFIFYTNPTTQNRVCTTIFDWAAAAEV